MQRAAWLRNRTEFIGLCSGRGVNLDLQMLFTFYEFLVPVVVDFLVTIRTAPASVYEKVLPYFVKALFMLCMDYAQAFLFLMNDYEYLKKHLREVYDGILDNANRTLITLDIEFQHRLLAGLVANCSARGWNKMDQFIAELPGFEEANSMYDYHESYFGEHTPHAWRYTDTEADPKNDEAIDLFAEEIRALLIKVRDAPKRAVRVGHLVVSPHQEFGQYPTRLLGDPGGWVPSSK